MTPIESPDDLRRRNAHGGAVDHEGEGDVHLKTRRWRHHDHGGRYDKKKSMLLVVQRELKDIRMLQDELQIS